MRSRLLVLVPALVALVVLAGCMQSEEATKIGSNGKGRSVITLAVNTQELEGAIEMAQGMGLPIGQGLDKMDPRKELDPEVFKKRLAQAKGVTLISAEQKVDEERHVITLQVVVDFDSLEDLYLSGVISNIDAKLEKLDGGSYRFTRVLGADRIPDAGQDPEAAGMMEAMLGMFEPFLASLEMAFDITLPTAIIETSGSIIGPNKVRWALGYKDILDSGKRTQTVEFGGEGLTWKPFTVTAADVAKAQREAAQAATTTPTEKDGEQEGTDGAPKDADPKDGEAETEEPLKTR